MRLINSKSLEMEEFFDHNIPHYATLSHTWGKEEVTFQDMQGRGTRKKGGFSKILGCCEQAKQDGLEWVWIDTCCIDKSSSAELTEAINSMFKWYQRAVVCFVFLKDLDPETDSLENCNWFRRGWTLQELITPRHIRFFDKS